VIVEFRLSDDDIERLAARIVELLSPTSSRGHQPWLDVGEAGRHLGLTENAIRGLVKRARIPVHKTENGRLRFAVTELDEWVRTGLARRPSGTYHDRP